MKQLMIKPSIYLYDTAKEFAAAFTIGEKDLVLTNKRLYERVFAQMNLKCTVLFRENYGKGEPTDMMAEAIAADIPTDTKRIVAIGGGSILDLAKLYALKQTVPVADLFDGKIPVQKDKEAVRVEQEALKNRTNLIAAARNGDEEAMESLTMEDMDTYSMISQRIATDDILTIVDSYFMPYGIECDQYNIMGEILDFMMFKNIVTGEEICQLTVDCNDMQFDICINKQDLLGEPEIGRRFKGIIWLQGELHI